MRARKLKHSHERAEACGDYLVRSPIEYKGKWQEIFGNFNPVHLEIGCGKGSFVLGMAKLHPDINFIALERVFDIIVPALEKVNAEKLPNVRFICCDAKELCEIFDEGFFDTIYLNFPDPWHKARHAKRRLTSETFLGTYKYLLKKGGSVNFKTDNRPLFDFSLESFEAGGFELKKVTFDLHRSEYNEGNVETEYERNFSAKGFAINRLEAYPLRSE